MERWQVGPSTIWVEDGIVFHQLKPDVVFTVEDYERVEAKIGEIAGSSPMPVVGINERSARADPEVRRRASASETSALCSALAIVTGSRVMVVVINFFMRFSRPPFPVRIFSDLDSAVAWARQYARD